MCLFMDFQVNTVDREMFTGIIEEIGTVRSIRGGGSGVVLDIEASNVLEGTAVGDSIAVNGVCLTVTPYSGHFTADAMPETLRRTSLGSLSAGSRVNLERAMLCGGRFGGHIVSGHVDACGRVAALTREGIAVLMRVEVPSGIIKYIARKGSVTLDGVSLTVASVGEDGLTVSLIPHTAASTTLSLLRVGSPVNVEVDMLARYVERMLSFGTGLQSEASANASVRDGIVAGCAGETSEGGLTEEFLKRYGF